MVAFNAMVGLVGLEPTASCTPWSPRRPLAVRIIQPFPANTRLQPSFAFYGPNPVRMQLNTFNCERRLMLDGFCHAAFVLLEPAPQIVRLTNVATTRFKAAQNVNVKHKDNYNSKRTKLVLFDGRVQRDGRASGT